MIETILPTKIVRCAGCGADVAAHAKYCGQCGAMIGSHESVGGDMAERKFLTILFADIRNSTSMIQALDPEDAMAKLRPAIDVMIGAVRDAGGMVSRTQGDGIMALFGAPIAVDDHAVRACRAALLIFDRMLTLADRDISVRVGIHSGEVVAHVDAGDFAQAYDVTGPAAHLAARLEQGAEPNTALISESTWKLVRNVVEARPKSGLTFKGFDQDVNVWQLVGLTQRSRWAARQASGLSPFVGRAVELNLLRERVERAHAGSPQILTIGGEPGTGKSRLAHELIGWARANNGWSIWEAYSETVSHRAPFDILRQLIFCWLGIDHLAAPADLEQVLRKGMQRADLPESSLAALCAVLNLPHTDAKWAEMDGPARTALIGDAVLAVIDRAQRERPLILALEDLHWADAESISVLLTAPQRLQAARLAIIATHRPMRQLPELSEHVLAITLHEFSAPSAARFLDLLLGNHASLTATKSELLDLTGRMPLFLEEAVRHLIEVGGVRDSAGGFAPVEGAPRPITPASIQAVAAARIDSLEPALKTLVRTASAIGRRFPCVLLADVMETDPAALTAQISRLAERHILFDSAGGPQDVLEFRHEFVREAAYSGLLRERRQGLHRSILEAIERRFYDQLRNWTAVLAHHAAEAKLWEKAADYERKAADGAIDSSSYAAALAACQRALGHLAKLQRSPNTIAQGIDVRLMLRGALGPTSDFATWLRLADEALKEAIECDDTSRTLIASVHRAWALNFAGEPREAVPAALAAFELAERFQDSAACAVSNFVLGQARYAAGDYLPALAALDAAAEWYVGERRMIRSGGSATTAVSCQMMRATCLASLGRFAPARDAVEATHSLAALTNRPYDLALAHYGRGVTAMLQGLPTAAADALEQGRDICRTKGLPTFQLLIETHLGSAYLAIARKDEARAMLESADGAAAKMNHIVALVACAVFRGALLLADGDSGEASRALQEARADARQRGFKGLEISAGRFLGLAHLASQPTDCQAAVEALSHAIATAQQCAALPQQARCQLALAGAELKRGNRVVARQHAEKAKISFISMGLGAEAANAEKLSKV